MGFKTKEKLMFALPAINAICGWAHNSEEFFDYTGDYLAWSGKTFHYVGTYTHFIKEYVSFHHGELKGIMWS